MESAGASVRYHAQDGRYPEKQFSVDFSQGWLAYLVSVKMAYKILRLSDVEGLAKTYLNAWKLGKVCCPKRLLFSSEGLSQIRSKKKLMQTVAT